MSYYNATVYVKKFSNGTIQGDEKFLTHYRQKAYALVERDLKKYNLKLNSQLAERDENWSGWTTTQKYNSWYRIKRSLTKVSILNAQEQFLKERQTEEPNYNCIKNGVKVPRKI